MTDHTPINPVFKNAGEAALIIEFGDTLDLSVNRAVQLFDRYLSNTNTVGVTDTVPTLRSVLVRFDPLMVSAAELQSQLAQQIGSIDWSDTTLAQNFTRWRVPVCYGGEHGEDLNEVASLLNLTADQVIAEHCKAIQKVLTLGFAPGFYYLGLLPSHWDLPRLDKVKPFVPPGSVSVAVSQTVVTSTAIPTGWRTIGRTPFCNFDCSAEPPVKIVAGDEVVFYAIDNDEFAHLTHTSAQGQNIITGSPLGTEL
jgi:KipI family sensor histidine kinase inhibitor